jgi:hypothetical protein
VPVAACREGPLSSTAWLVGWTAALFCGRSELEEYEVRRLLILLFAACVFAFVASFEDTLLPYWEVRLPKVWALVRDHEYARAFVMLAEKPKRGEFPARKAGEKEAATDNAAAAESEEEVIRIDLIAGTLNGRSFFSYTLNELTDLLGHPTLVHNSKIVEDLGDVYSFGPEVKYHDLGLHFWFQHPDYDAETHCYKVDIHMSDTWDAHGSRRYESFPGTIVQGVTGDWKAKQVLSDIVIPGIGSDEDGLENESAGGHAIRLEGHTVEFSYEATTRFLEAVRLVHPKLG